MKVKVICRTNHDTPYINTLIMKDQRGKSVIIDREKTEYRYDPQTHEMFMTWIGCYIWNPSTSTGHSIRMSDNLFKEEYFCLQLEAEDDAPDGYFADAVVIAFMDDEGNTRYYQNWYSGDEAILIEKPNGEGLTIDEINRITRYLDPEKEIIPIQIDSNGGNSSAFGFITIEAEEKLISDAYYNAVRSEYLPEFKDYVGDILADMSLEHDDGKYMFRGVPFYLTRNI